MTPTQEHKLDLGRLRGIRLTCEYVPGEDEEIDIATGIDWRFNDRADMSYLKPKSDIRILPAEEPLNPALVRWNTKCVEWLPKLEKFQVGLFWAVYLALMLGVIFWLNGKYWGWW